MAKEIFLSVEIDNGTLPKSKVELMFSNGALIVIYPEYTSEITSPKSKLEIIEFEISKGWYPEFETGNKEKLKTSPDVELKFKLLGEYEITLRVFELITEADIEWSSSLPTMQLNFAHILLQRELIYLAEN